MPPNGEQPVQPSRVEPADPLGARRPFIALCVIYLLLGFAQAGHFMTTGLAELRQDATDAAGQAHALQLSVENDQVDEAIQFDSPVLLTLQEQSDVLSEQLNSATAVVNETDKDDDDAIADAEHEVGQLENLKAANQLERGRITKRIAAGQARLDEVARADAFVLSSDANVRRGWIRLAALGLALLTVVYFLAIDRRRLRTRADVVGSTTIMVIIVGVLLLASRLVLQRASPNLTTWGLMDLFVLHITACLVLPWTTREAIVPFVPLLLIWSLTFLAPGATDFEIFDRLVGVIVSPIALVPGALIAAWSARRRAEDDERRMLGIQVRSMGGELTRARIVHDAMFPDPTDTGHVSFEYEYLPIAEIGGDYVHLHVCQRTDRVYLTLLDVAGHGLAAALTVNRLFGELERIRAEDANASPADIISLLNRYISLTMARHDLYATGTCIMLDPNSGDLVWSNAGHPPAMLRRANGDVTELTCTTVLLGALDPDEFHADEHRTRITPGDVVIAYTDGTFEARNKSGRCFGLDSLRKTAHFTPPPRSWPKFIAHAVTSHHDGCADDDILIASLTLRSLRVSSQPAAREEVVAAG